jgi:hypothetical protein
MSDPGTDTPIEMRPSAMIQVSADGTWQPAEDGFEALLLPVCEIGGAVIDIVAWQFGDPSIWWLRRGIATFIGEHELILARRDKRAVRLVGTPKEYLKQWGHALCILNWRGDVRARLAQAPHGIICDTEALADRVRRIVDQRPSERLLVTVAS